MCGMKSQAYVDKAIQFISTFLHPLYNNASLPPRKSGEKTGRNYMRGICASSVGV